MECPAAILLHGLRDIGGQGFYELLTKVMGSSPARHRAGIEWLSQFRGDEDVDKFLARYDPRGRSRSYGSSTYGRAQEAPERIMLDEESDPLSEEAAREEVEERLSRENEERLRASRRGAAGELSGEERAAFWEQNRAELQAMNERIAARARERARERERQREERDRRREAARAAQRAVAAAEAERRRSGRRVLTPEQRQASRERAEARLAALTPEQRAEREERQASRQRTQPPELPPLDEARGNELRDQARARLGLAAGAPLPRREESRILQQLNRERAEAFPEVLEARRRYLMTSPNRRHLLPQ